MASSREEAPSVDPGSARESDSAQPSKRRYDRRRRTKARRPAAGPVLAGHAHGERRSSSAWPGCSGLGGPGEPARGDRGQRRAASVARRRAGQAADHEAERAHRRTGRRGGAYARGRDRAERDHRLAAAVSVTRPSTWNWLDMRVASGPPRRRVGVPVDAALRLLAAGDRRAHRHHPDRGLGDHVSGRRRVLGLRGAWSASPKVCSFPRMGRACLRRRQATLRGTAVEMATCARAIGRVDLSRPTARYRKESRSARHRASELLTA